MESRRFMVVIYALFLSVVSAFPSFAMVATPSDAMRVPVATSSNALLSQDYMESDDFDTLEAPVLMSSGDDSVVNTVNLTSVQMCLSYYDMAGVIRYKEVWLDKNGYAPCHFLLTMHHLYGLVLSCIKVHYLRLVNIRCPYILVAILILYISPVPSGSVSGVIM